MLMRLLCALLVAVPLAVPAAAQVAAPAVPADWQMNVWELCEDAAAFTSGLAEADQQQRYATYQVEATAAARHLGKSLQWAFTVRPGAAAGTPPALFTRTGPEGVFDALTLWVKNPSGHDLDLVLLLVEQDGSTYASPPTRIAEARDWQEVVFFVDAVRLDAASRDENRRLAPPVRSVGIAFERAQPGQPYTVYVDHLTLFRAPEDRFEVPDLTTPPTARAGETIEVRASLRPPAQPRRPHDFVVALEIGGVRIAHAALPFAQPCTEWAAEAEVLSGPAALRVPAWATDGEYTVRVTADRATLSGLQAAGRTLRITGAPPGQTEANVQPLNGSPALFVNGKPQPGLGYMSYHWDQPYLTGFAQAGVHLVSCTTTSDYHLYGLAPDVWLGPGQYDYSGLDARLATILDQDPEAYLLLRVYMCSPEWWDRQHPGELVVFNNDQRELPPQGGERKRTYPSFASTAWRADAADALTRFIQHVEGSPFGNRVIGYQLASGHKEQWEYWGAFSGALGDYSEPQRQAYVTWLRARYRDDIRRLRQAWSRPVEPWPGEGPGGEDAIPAVTWETVRVPTVEDRRAHKTGVLLDPSASAEVSHYQLFHAEQVADTIAFFARAAKAACRGRKLVGAFYGHVLEHGCDPNGLQAGGHIAVQRILAVPELDFLGSPTSYTDRRPALGYSVFMGLTESVRAHGKLWVDENDIRTHLSPGEIGSLGKTADVQQTLDVQWREVANVLAHGSAMWWFDRTGGWYDDPQVLAAVGRMEQVAQQALAWDRASAGEIALVVDDISLAYLAEGTALSFPLLNRQKMELARIGAPVDVWLLEDIAAGLAPEYKLYIVANAFVMDEALREAVRAQLGRNGKTVLWIYAPGAVADRFSGRSIRDLTGFPAAFVERQGAIRVAITDPGHPLLADAAGVTEYGPTRPLAPVFFSDPRGVEVLGKLQVPLQQGTAGSAGLAALRFPTWTSIYSAAPDVPGPLLRSFARAAGVHLYVDTGDAVYANRSLVAIHAATTGQRTLYLPRRTDVYDLIADRLVGSNVTEVPLALVEGQTALYYIGDPARRGGP